MGLACDCRILNLFLLGFSLIRCSIPYSLPIKFKTTSTFPVVDLACIFFASTNLRRLCAKQATNLASLTHKLYSHQHPYNLGNHQESQSRMVPHDCCDNRIKQYWFCHLLYRCRSNTPTYNWSLFLL
jgi:hypothetical protein